MCFAERKHFFHRKERKDLNFFQVVPIFTELGQDLTHLAHKEKTQSDIFLGQAKNFNCILFSWGSDIQDSDIPSPMVEKSTLWGPHKLLKILANSPNTLMQPTLDQKRKRKFYSLSWIR
jgi:hypothetical protein